jgi:hypothetical protein
VKLITNVQQCTLTRNGRNDLSLMPAKAVGDQLRLADPESIASTHGPTSGYLQAIEDGGLARVVKTKDENTHFFASNQPPKDLRK